MACKLSWQGSPYPDVPLCRHLSDRMCHALVKMVSHLLWITPCYYKCLPYEGLSTQKSLACFLGALLYCMTGAVCKHLL